MGQEPVGTTVLSNGPAEFQPQHLLLPLAVGVWGTAAAERESGADPSCRRSESGSLCVCDRWLIVQ